MLQGAALTDDTAAPGGVTTFAWLRAWNGGAAGL